jgi:ParB family transcriptional regulator, chromosome partitioning protein
MSTKERMPRKDVFYVPVTEVQEIKGSIEYGGKIFKENIRTDYGDLKLLAEQILANDGIRVPCKGFKKDGVYYLTDGHRRYRAAMMILEDTAQITSIPMMMSEKGLTEDTRIIDMIICNEGKSLNPIEHATAVERLRELDYSDAEICKKTGFTKVYLSNLKLLDKSTEKIKNLIREDVMSATLAMKLLREEKDIKKVEDMVDNAMFQKQMTKTGGSNKVTEKDVIKSKGENNSFAALKRALKKGKEHIVRMDNINTYELLTNLAEGKLSSEYFMELLFEPATNERFKKESEKERVDRILED